MSRRTLDSACCLPVSHTGLSPSAAGFPKTVLLPSGMRPAVRTPAAYAAGLPSFPSARRYSGNRSFFLFLRVLRCFSSPGSPRRAMDSPCGGGGLLRRVSPFRNLRVAGYLLLAAAYRSLSRLSSALSAKASALCPSLLNLLRLLSLPHCCLAWQHAACSSFSLSGCLTSCPLCGTGCHCFTSVCGFQCAGGAALLHATSGDGEIRTHDPLLARQVLSQLSYTPISI